MISVLGAGNCAPRLLLILCLICVFLKEGVLDLGASVNSGDYYGSKGGSTGEETKSARRLRRQAVEEEDEEEAGEKRQIRGLHNEHQANGLWKEDGVHSR